MRFLEVIGRNLSIDDEGYSKSKIPVFPGLNPVAIDAHAGAVTGGIVDLIGAHLELSLSARRFGIVASAINFSRRSQVPPSNPNRRTRPEGSPITKPIGPNRHRSFSLCPDRNDAAVKG